MLYCYCMEDTLQKKIAKRYLEIINESPEDIRLALISDGLHAFLTAAVIVHGQKAIQYSNNNFFKEV